jgi:hypothetical protein
MKNVIVTVGFMLCLPLSVSAQSPLDFYKGTNRYIEKENYCIVNGARLHYWLCILTVEGQGISDSIIADDPDLDNALVAYAESLGWTRDYTQEANTLWPNTQLAVSVKNMMKTHGACVSMTIVAEGQKSAALVIHGRFFPEFFGSSFYALMR